jgi:hypothetical protein
MSDEQITAALLRADAELFAADAGNSSLISPTWSARLTRAAAALEEKAERLEQGERVCRWVAQHDYGGWRNCMHRHIWPGRAGLYCTDCGGRVVLGDEEASDE